MSLRLQENNFWKILQAAGSIHLQETTVNFVWISKLYSQIKQIMNDEPTSLYCRFTISNHQTYSRYMGQQPASPNYNWISP